MTGTILLYPVLLPVIAGLLLFLVPSKVKVVKELVTVLVTAAVLVLTIMLFGKELSFVMPWAGKWFEFNFRLYHFSAFITLAVSGFGFLVALYSSFSMSGRNFTGAFFALLLIAVGFVNGAVLANNLILMLFFWEGILGVMFGMIAIGRKDAFKTATKAFIIVGVSDLCMMAGIAITGYLAGTFTMTGISIDIHGKLPGLAFVLLMVGAISKAGSMPFHSWIPDAALDAPLPFMAILPASLEKLLGIYFLSRISFDLFKVDSHSWVSMLMMIIGAVTILLAVMMALVQKDYKKLLSYHAISQVGYMILGVGTFIPIAMVGGVFHMINHAMYKSTLFLTGGAVEKQAGTTDLTKLGGLARKMPWTFICFAIAAAAISGVPPFNGFFSKELIYDGALERHWVFYAAAALGSFFTAASFLKLGHAAFFGPLAKENENVKEAPFFMVLPMVIIAGLCILFGVYNKLPLESLIQPIFGQHVLEGRSFVGWPHNSFLVIMTLVVLALALLNHLFGVKRTGKGIGAVDHIHHAPVLSVIYDKAERRWFDPYDLSMYVVNGLSRVLYWIDRANDWMYNVFTVRLVAAFNHVIRRMHDGKFGTYLLWSLLGFVVIVVYIWKKVHTG